MNADSISSRPRTFFESRHVLVLTYNPPDLRASKVASMMYTETGGRRETYADTVLRTFRRTCEEIERALDNVFRVQRLGAEEVTDDQGRTVVFDRFIQHLNFCITGDDHPIALPPIPMYLDAMLGTEFVSAITPMVGDAYVLVVAIEGFPSTSYSGILNVLDQLAILYRWSTRFIFLDHIDAEKHLAKERRKWAQKTRSFMNQVFNPQGGVVNQDSVQMVAEVEAAMAEAASNLVAYGYYSSNVILYGRDLQQVEYDAQAVRKELQRIGFSARIETINTTEAYLGSLPGHGVQNIRRPMIHTLNLADMLPINAVWAGRTVNPCPFYPPESPPLMQVATTGSTPMRVNLHSGDVGHTCIFGPTGSGKSTLLGLIAAQFRRYPEAQVFAVDKGRSMLPLTLAVGRQALRHRRRGREPRLLPARQHQNRRRPGVGGRMGLHAHRAPERHADARAAQRDPACADHHAPVQDREDPLGLPDHLAIQGAAGGDRALHDGGPVRGAPRQRDGHALLRGVPDL